MRTGWMAAALLAVGGRAWAADATVFVTGEAVAFTQVARSTVDGLFQKAGITIDWRGPQAPAGGIPRTWLRIEVAERTPEALLPGALAVSYPYSRCEKGITVFLDRVRLRAREILQEPVLLGYVMAHEMTHVLQRAEHHSTEGLMKAHWNLDDRAAIFHRRLGFLEEDVRMLRDGLAAGGCGAAAGLTARSLPGIAAHPR